MTRRRGLALGIRGKLLVVALGLLAIPWTGYQYVRELKSFILQGQQNVLLLTARAVATVLHDRPELFHPETGVPDLIGSRYDLFAGSLPGPIRLDGLVKDWGDAIEHGVTYDDRFRYICTADYAPESLSFTYALGYRADYLYGIFEITDDHIVYRDTSLRRLDNSDHLRLTLAASGEPVRRYLLSGVRPGRLSVYQMEPDWRQPTTGQPVYEISAEWRETETGYNIELRMPRFMIEPDTRVAFHVADVDEEPRRTVERVVGTSPGDDVLGRVLLHSPEIEKILRGLDRPAARLRIFDREQRVRAMLGRRSPPVTTSATPRNWRDRVLVPIYRLILDRPRAHPESPESLAARESELVRAAINGNPGTWRRRTEDARGEIVMAVYPIWWGEEILGAVAVEQSSDAIETLQERVLENVVSATLIVFFLVSLALITFASRLTWRIRRLRNSADRAIDSVGRVRDTDIDAEARASDEIGDLSRGISDMLRRLGQHQNYLEAMPDTLAHEFRNPLNVVNSSLDNLAAAVDEAAREKYIGRAREGIRRLGRILTSLTEAASLDEAMRSGSTDTVELEPLLSGAVEGYRLAHPQREFQLRMEGGPLRISGSADHLAQMLDKLVDNALDFGDPEHPVLIDAGRGETDEVCVRVINAGPPLPEGRIFDPMVSMAGRRTTEPHLGLGLYIVRLIVQFHRGRISARSREDMPGAVFEVCFPVVG